MTGSHNILVLTHCIFYQNFFFLS